ncbi:MAG: hypothetical protein SFV22_08615 [Saprospiraceae bacterium]|nr:hypothetical protein [Saprospiraceae bacterium]
MKIKLLLIVSTLASLLFFALCNPSKKQVGSVDKESNWLDHLPSCPCESPDKNGVKLNDGWAKDVGNIAKYHKGATESFRSYPPIQTAEGLSGQQCCYDSEGKLITEGSGAGTPDKVSTCDGEDSKGIMTTRYGGVLWHFKKDVKPWESMGGVDSGWVKYNLIWKPNNGNGCPPNKVNK